MSEYPNDHLVLVQVYIVSLFQVTAHLHNSMRDQLQEDYMNKNNSITVAWDNLMIKVRYEIDVHAAVDAAHMCKTTGTMTSSNENIFRVTCPLCGEFTGHR